MTLLPSPEDTLRWGEELGRSLEAGDVIALVGDLGAGKTHAVKGIARGLGSMREVTSPTFTLVHEYDGGRLPVFHFDFYRMDHAREAFSLGWDEILDERGIVVVEWADKFPELLPPHARWFQFEPLQEGGRQVMERPR